VSSVLATVAPAEAGGARAAVDVGAATLSGRATGALSAEEVAGGTCSDSAPAVGDVAHASIAVATRTQAVSRNIRRATCRRGLFTVLNPSSIESIGSFQHSQNQETGRWQA
jgi:hypothetical protein